MVLIRHEMYLSLQGVEATVGICESCYERTGISSQGMKCKTMDPYSQNLSRNEIVNVISE